MQLLHKQYARTINNREASDVRTGRVVGGGGEREKRKVRATASSLPGSSLAGGGGAAAGRLPVALAQTPRPSSSACRGLASPGRWRQASPAPQRPVYTPHGRPRLSAQVTQQPQPGSRTLSAQSSGRGRHRSRAAASQGSHRTTGPAAPERRASDATTRVTQSARKRGSMAWRREGGGGGGGGGVGGRVGPAAVAPVSVA